MVRTVTFLMAVVLLALGPGATADDKKPAEFITKAGTYKLFDGKLEVAVTAGAAGTSYSFTIPLGGGKSIKHASAKDEIKKGAEWFIYPESADRVWVFNGADLLRMEFMEGNAVVKGSSAVPGLVKAAPEAVRKRLPDEFKKKHPDK